MLVLAFTQALPTLRSAPGRGTGKPVFEVGLNIKAQAFRQAEEGRNMLYPPATADEGLISKTHTAQCTHNAERKQKT